MAPTLRQLLDDPGLGLTLLTGEHRLDETVRWVATNEHPDPTPFLRGGELLLTTGIKLPRTTEAVRAYTDRVAAAGAVALGLGIGLGHDHAPRRLVAAAEGSGLALVEVDEPTQFVAVSKTLADLIAREERTEMVQTGQATRELTRAVVRDGPGSVARTTARLIGGWAMVLDRAATIRHAEPPEASERLAEVLPTIERMASGKIAAATLIEGEEHVSVQTLSASGRGHGYLVCGTRHRPGGVERAVLGLATALLSITDDRQLFGYRKRYAALLRLARQGTVTDPALLVDLGAGVLAGTEVRALVTTGPRPDVRALADALDDLPAEHALASTDGDRLRAIFAPGQLDAVTQHLQRWSRLRSGLSETLAPERVALALTQAERAMDLAERRATAVLTHAEVVAGPVGLVDPDDAEAFAHRLLGPLEAHARRTDVDLVTTLEVWLRHHGHHEAAASELGIHRHTLRHRVRRAEQLLGRPFDDVDTRMDLWFALRTRHPGQR